MPPGSTPTTGIIVFHRKGSSVTFNADGTRTYALGRHDTPENLCQTLR